MHDLKLRTHLSKNIYTYPVIFSLFSCESIWKSACVSTCLFGSDNQSPRLPKLVPDVYTIFPSPCWRSTEVHKHGGFILGSVNLCKIFRRISEFFELKTVKCFLYQSPITSQFLDLIH